MLVIKFYLSPYVEILYNRNFYISAGLMLL
jgi:hypothetical protein